MARISWSAAGVTFDQVINFTVDVGTAAGRYVQVYATSGGGIQLSSATIDGVSVVPQQADVDAAGKYFYLIEALVTGTGLIAVSLTYAATGSTKYYSYGGYDGIASVRNTGKNLIGGSNAAPTITMTTVSGDLVVMQGGDSIYGTTFAASAPATTLNADGVAFMAEETATTTSTTVDGTLTANAPWGVVAAVLVPSGSGATTLAGDGRSTSEASAQLPPVVDLAGDGSASTTGSAQLPPVVDLAGDGSSSTIASGQMQAVIDLAGSGTSDTSAAGVVGIPSIITAPLKNNTGTVLASAVIPKVGIYKLSDMTLVLALTSQTTDASGRLYFESISLVIGDDYLVVTSDATGAAVGVSKNTAA